MANIGKEALNWLRRRHHNTGLVEAALFRDANSPDAELVEIGPGQHSRLRRAGSAVQVVASAGIKKTGLARVARFVQGDAMTPDDVVEAMEVACTNLQTIHAQETDDRQLEISDWGNYEGLGRGHMDEAILNDLRAIQRYITENGVTNPINRVFRDADTTSAIFAIAFIDDDDSRSDVDDSVRQLAKTLATEMLEAKAEQYQDLDASDRNLINFAVQTFSSDGESRLTRAKKVAEFFDSSRGIFDWNSNVPAHIQLNEYLRKLQAGYGKVLGTQVGRILAHEMGKFLKEPLTGYLGQERLYLDDGSGEAQSLLNTLSRIWQTGLTDDATIRGDTLVQKLIHIIETPNIDDDRTELAKDFMVELHQRIHHGRDLEREKLEAEKVFTAVSKHIIADSGRGTVMNIDVDLATDEQIRNFVLQKTDFMDFIAFCNNSQPPRIGPHSRSDYIAYLASRDTNKIQVVPVAENRARAQVNLDNATNAYNDHNLHMGRVFVAINNANSVIPGLGDDLTKILSCLDGEEFASVTVDFAALANKDYRFILDRADDLLEQKIQDIQEGIADLNTSLLMQEGSLSDYIAMQVDVGDPFGGLNAAVMQSFMDFVDRDGLALDRSFNQMVEDGMSHAEIYLELLDRYYSSNKLLKLCPNGDPAERLLEHMDNAVAVDYINDSANHEMHNGSLVLRGYPALDIGQWNSRDRDNITETLTILREARDAGFVFPTLAPNHRLVELSYERNTAAEHNSYKTELRTAKSGAEALADTREKIRLQQELIQKTRTRGTDEYNRAREQIFRHIGEELCEDVNRYFSIMSRSDRGLRKDLHLNMFVIIKQVLMALAEDFMRLLPEEAQAFERGVNSKAREMGVAGAFGDDAIAKRESN